MIDVDHVINPPLDRTDMTIESVCVCVSIINFTESFQTYATCVCILLHRQRRQQRHLLDTMVTLMELKSILQSNDLDSIKTAFPHCTQTINGISTYEIIEHLKNEPMDAIRILRHFSLLDCDRLNVISEYQTDAGIFTMKFMEVLRSITDPDLRFCNNEFTHKYLLWNRNVCKTYFDASCSTAKCIEIIDALNKTKTRLKTMVIVSNTNTPHEHITRYLNSDLASDLITLRISMSIYTLNIVGERKIFDGFHNHANLTCLELKHHSMDKNTSLSLTLLLEKTTSIETLILDDLRVDDFKPVFEAVGKNTTLIHLHVGQLQLTTLEARALKYALSENNNILKFACEKMMITDDALNIIYKGISSNAFTGHYFSFMGNDSLSTRQPGRYNLKTLISKNTSLKTLNLSLCTLSDGALTGISRGLMENKTLENLTLSNECFGKVGLEHLCDTLSNHNTTLKSLDLSWNQLERYDVIKPLLEYLAKNGPLQSLDLSGNDLTANESATKLNTNDCTLTKTILKRLMISLSTNTNLNTLYLGDHPKASTYVPTIEWAVPILNITHINLQHELSGRTPDEIDFADRATMINLRLSRNGN